MRFFYSSLSQFRQLGPLEKRVLEELWARGSATVREMIEDGFSDLAYTTVMTTLDRLFKKGLLTRLGEGKAFRYSARLSRDDLHRETAGHAFRRLLDVSPESSLPLSFLVDVLGERDIQMLDALGKAIESKRRTLPQSNSAGKRNA
jgi:predicted transcriptional regulator